MTDQGLQFPKFYVTAPAPCPYIEDLTERKVFTELKGPDAPALNEALGRVGFRRSQSVMYRPACENCGACISVRVRTPDYTHSKSARKILKTNTDVIGITRPPLATSEQYELLRVYLESRHADGTMAGMSIAEYQDMVESSPVQTVVIEYRRALDGKLMGVALTDELSDGYSMVYSFFDVENTKRSFGTFIILDHIARAKRGNRPYVYLGYWVEGSRKMDYKRRFKPLERLGPDGWIDFTD